MGEAAAAPHIYITHAKNQNHYSPGKSIPTRENLEKIRGRMMGGHSSAQTAHLQIRRSLETIPRRSKDKEADLQQRVTTNGKTA